jgi:hypothetical protein
MEAFLACPYGKDAPIEGFIEVRMQFQCCHLRG